MANESTCIGHGIAHKLSNVFMRKVNREALEKKSCAVCWELHFNKDLIMEDVSTPASLDLINPLRSMGRWNSRAVFEFDDEHQHLNGFPLLSSAISIVENQGSTIRICKSCRNSLQQSPSTSKAKKKKTSQVPKRATANDLWLGDPSPTMKELNIPMKLLVCQR